MFTQVSRERAESDTNARSGRTPSVAYVSRNTWMASAAMVGAGRVVLLVRNTRVLPIACDSAGIQLLHVPFKDGAQMLGAVANGVSDNPLVFTDTNVRGTQVLLEAALQHVRPEKPAAAQTSSSTHIKAAALIAKMRASGELSLNRVIGFLREKRLNLFIEGLAVLSMLDARTINSLAFEGEGQGMAVVCRAIGADRSQFATITLLLERARTGKAVPAARLQAVCQLFDSMPEERANGIIEQWRARASPGVETAA